VLTWEVQSEGLGGGGVKCYGSQVLGGFLGGGGLGIFKHQFYSWPWLDMAVDDAQGGRDLVVSEVSAFFCGEGRVGGFAGRGEGCICRSKVLGGWGARGTGFVNDRGWAWLCMMQRGAETWW
jgi:hypothetical protein